MFKKIALLVLFITLLSVSFALSGEEDKKRINTHNGSSLTEHVLGSYNSSAGKKSPFLAVLYSVILPGAGEYYTDRFDVGKYSFAGEVGLWLLYSGMNIHGYQIRNDARAYARLHAGFDDEGKSDEYYVNVSNFMSAYDFNEKRLRDRDYKSIYDPYSNMTWQWDSESSRKKFRDMRVSADEVINNTKFVVVAMIANRIFSAINAARLTSNYNSELNLTVSPLRSKNYFDGFALNISAGF